MHLTPARVILEEGKPQLKKCLHQIGPWASLWYIYLLGDGCERAELTVVCATPGLVILGAVREQAEQVMRNKPISIAPPWLLHQLPPSGPCPV